MSYHESQQLIDYSAREIPVSPYEVLLPPDYLRDLKYETDRAKNRVWTQAMYVADSDHATGSVGQMLINAAKRGLDTRFQADTYSFMVDASGFPLWTKDPMILREKNTLIERKGQMYKDLETNGVSVTYINPPKGIKDILIPYQGRNHIKMTLIDDIAYLGGLNLYDTGFGAADFMVKITDKTIVDALAQQFEMVNEQKPEHDYEVTAQNGQLKLLVDRGQPGESIILDQATNLVNKAKFSVQLLTPFTPSGSFLKALHAADARGISVDVISCDPAILKRTEAVSDILNQINTARMKLSGKNIPIRYLTDQKLHAKLLIIDRQIAILGSHNFAQEGVRQGTEEIALETTHTALVQNLVDYFQLLRAHSH